MKSVVSIKIFVVTMKAFKTITLFSITVDLLNIFVMPLLL